MAKQAKRAKSAPVGTRAKPTRAKPQQEAARRRVDPSEPSAVAVDMLTLQVNWPRRKQPVNLRIDGDIIEWFRRGGAGYQTRMNAVLRAFVDAQPKRR
jgi:uncharacterized protein (DUF4415 family)